MAKPILLPQVGQDLETAVLSEWRIHENEPVKKGDIVALVESDKASFEVEAFEEGILLKKLYQEGDEARVLQPIAYVGQPGESIDAEGTAAAGTPVAAEPPAAAEAPNPAVAATGAKRAISPSARRVAREHGVELSGVPGSGPNGRVVKKDVLARIASGTAAVSAAPAPLEEDEVVPFSKMRQKIADRLTYSKQTIPHFYLNIDVNMSAAVEWRRKHNGSGAFKVTFNDLMIKAAAGALARCRALNAHVEKDRLILKKEINIGVAVALADGLIVPVIPGCDGKGLAEISRISRENAEGARRGVLKTQAEGTFTVSNLGMYAVDGFMPIINPPECAILGIGGIQDRLVVNADRSLAVAQVMKLTLACDHRAVNGSEAAEFLNELKANLETCNFE